MRTKKAPKTKRARKGINPRLEDLNKTDAEINAGHISFDPECRCALCEQKERDSAIA